MGIRVEEPHLKQLRQEALLTDGNEGADLLRLALAQLFAVHPLGNQQAASAQLVVHARNVHALHAFLGEQAPDFGLVVSLVLEVELSIKSHGPLVQKPNVVGTLLRGKALDEALIDLSGAPEHIQVLAHGLQHSRALDFDGHPLTAVCQLGFMHLGQRRGGHGLLGYFREGRAQWRAQLSLNCLDGYARLEGLHAVLQGGELVQRNLRQDVWPHAHHLARFNVRWPQLLHDESRLPGEAGALGCELVGAALNAQRDDAREQRHAQPHELRPALLQRAALRAPVLFDGIAVVHTRQSGHIAVVIVV
mmetsp:Transcript_11745/g.49470  ORF Transcript_11745/g.49470 Transcript_11745/m.49470 type:complete len:305 (+) Transcript_11745:1546-2460(+)